MELYDAIFYRRTIKKYSHKSLKSSLMNEVVEICSNLNYLNKELDIKAHVIDRGHLIRLIMGKECSINAPHYILVTSKSGEGQLQNVGYAMEEVILKLTGLGIATAWISTKLKREDILDFVELEDNIKPDVIVNLSKDEDEVDTNEETEEQEDINLENPIAVIAFGYPEKDYKLFRSTESKKLDRKDTKGISKGFDISWKNILEAIRIAPSVKNTQPWMLYFKKNNIYIYEENQKKSLKSMSKVSMGIALRHFVIACKKENIDIKFERTKFKKKIGKEYFITGILNEI